MAQIKLNATYGMTGTLPAVSATNLTSIPAGNLTGTVADARISTLTSSKLSGNLPALNASALTTINASNISSGTLSTSRYVQGGITETDQWRLTTSFTSNADPIASNWERNDGSGFGLLGTGMTESSGIFTFPSTGYWLIIYKCLGGTQYSPSAHTQGVWIDIKTTLNNSSYTNISSSQQGAYNFSTAYYTGMSLYTDYQFDVTNTTNCKIRFGFGAGQGGEACRGHTSYQHTGVSFIRLGDT